MNTDGTTKKRRGDAAKIVFSQLEIDWLRIRAEKKRAELYQAKLYPHKVFEENRYEFVREYMRGANPCGTPKEQAWLKKIRKELDQLPMNQGAASARTTTSHSA
jgi:hypothetical protein